MTAYCAINDQGEGPFAVPIWGLEYLILCSTLRSNPLPQAVILTVPLKDTLAVTLSHSSPGDR